MIPERKTGRYLSPFSYKRNYNLRWKRIDTRWQGTNQLDSITPTAKSRLKLVEQLKVITSIQLGKAMAPNDIRNCRKILSKYESLGFLIKHTLENKSITIPFYTLGPAGAKALGLPFHPNWWLDLKLNAVLKHLILNQLFLKAHKTVQCKILTAPYPITSVFIMGNAEFPVMVVRGDVEDLAREARWMTFNRVLVVCEDESQIPVIAPNIKVDARYTTDYNLCHTLLNDAFYRWVQEEEKYYIDTIDIFSSNT